MTEKQKNENDPLWVLLLVVGGLLGVSSVFFVSNVELVLFTVFLGLTLILVAVLFAFNIIHVSEKQLQKLKKNQKGALWIWAVCLLSIVTLAIAWFALTWPVFMFIDAIQEHYTFPAQVQPAISLIVAVMGWFLILMSLGLLLWAYVNSQRREEQTYPM